MIPSLINKIKNIIKKNTTRDFIYNNDVIALKIAGTLLYFGVDISTPGEDSNIIINKAESLKGHQCCYFNGNDLDTTKHITILKIFNMFNYTELPQTFNRNVVSLAFYNHNILSTLALANNQKILGVNGILMEDKSGLNQAIVLPKNKITMGATNVDPYKENSLFYLFPLDEMQYYNNLLKN